MKGKIPIKAAERLAEQYDCPMVIIFGLHDNGDRFSMTTYGKTKGLCRAAASLGSEIVEAILHGTVSPSQAEPTRLPNVPTEWEGTKGAAP